MIVLTKKIFWFIGGFAVVVIAIMVLTNGKQQSAVIDTKGQPFIGEESAPVDIVEFGDYQCPHCLAFNKQVLPMIQEEVVDTGTAKFYFMNYPVIGPESTSAALFAETVLDKLGSDRFWKFHHRLFDNQMTDDGKANLMTDELLENVLAEITDSDEVQQVVEAYKDGDSSKALKKDISAANSLGVASTPTLYINGKKFDGQSDQEFIDQVKKAAEDGE